MTSSHDLPRRDLPPGPWQTLFSRAWTLMDGLRTASGINTPFWTLGGGTVLMFLHDHRASKDIDIFVPDPQYLGYLTPRLNDVAAEMTSNYVEDASSYLKLQFDEGEIDFVAAPNLTEEAWEWWNIEGHSVRVESSAEIIAKKMYHRGREATARDLFDLCLVIEKNPDGLRRASSFLLQNAPTFLDRINARPRRLEAAFDQIDVRNYKPSLDECIRSANEFLGSL